MYIRINATVVKRRDNLKENRSFFSPSFIQELFGSSDFQWVAGADFAAVGAFRLLEDPPGVPSCRGG